MLSICVIAQQMGRHFGGKKGIKLSIDEKYAHKSL
jgi:hypothetical protein